MSYYLKKQKKNTPHSTFKALFDMEDLNQIWDILKENHDESLYNLILTLKYCFYRLDTTTLPLNIIEKKIYKDFTTEELYVNLILNVEKIFEPIFNEMIKKDTDVINKPVWTAINLDSLYSIKFNHLDLTYVFKRKDPTLAYKIANINILVSTLERINGVYLYTKLKEGSYPNDLVENIKFTKGYLVCFNPDIVKDFKNFKYMRKLICKKPLVINPKKKTTTLLDSLDNNNFTNPIWLRNSDFNLIDLKNYNIYGKKLLNKKIKIKILCSSLNFLNSIKLSYNKSLWETIVKTIENSTDIHHTLTNKNKLTSIIYNVSIRSEIEEINTNFSSKSIKTLINSASVLDLIGKQLNYYTHFYLDHRLDSRLRIYCYPWPVNYQLNHVVRNILKFESKNNYEEVLNNFYKHPIIKKYINNYNIFEHSAFQDNEIFKNLEDSLIIKTENKKINDLKKEYLFYLITKLSPNSIKNIEEKLIFANEFLNDFMEDDLSKNWRKWLNVLKLKEKKIPYLLSFQQALKDLNKDKFDVIYWGDASSNAIQLITLRLQLFSDELLMLTNIINNETTYDNIYDYVTLKIKETDHGEIVKKLNNKITEKEVADLQEKDLNKYLIMPSSYGMGKWAYRGKIENLLETADKQKIWESLNFNEKILISDYFWDLAVKYLKEIGFDLNFYKQICNDFWKDNGCDVFIWKNDLGLPIVPFTKKKPKRHELLEKLNVLKLEKKETLKEEKIKKIEEKEKSLKKLLKEDEDLHWKRTMIVTEKNKIFSRIHYQKKIKINIRETRQSLIPNTIHAYDASVVHLVIAICKKIDIDILVIHDSIGCSPLYAPLIKTIFKIVNIHLLDLSLKNQRFPLNSLKFKEIENKKELYEKILNSKEFFK